MSLTYIRQQIGFCLLKRAQFLRTHFVSDFLENQHFSRAMPKKMLNKCNYEYNKVTAQIFQSKQTTERPTASVHFSEMSLIQMKIGSNDKMLFIEITAKEIVQKFS